MSARTPSHTMRGTHTPHPKNGHRLSKYLDQDLAFLSSASCALGPMVLPISHDPLKPARLWSQAGQPLSFQGIPLLLTALTYPRTSEALESWGTTENRSSGTVCARQRSCILPRQQKRAQTRQTLDFVSLHHKKLSSLPKQTSLPRNPQGSPSRCNPCTQFDHPHLHSQYPRCSQEP